MAAVDTGKSFANGEQLTAAKLNQMFGNSTFAPGAVDNSTMTVNSLGQLAVNQVTSSNIATNSLNLDDIQQIDTNKVLGRLSTSTGNVEQITVDEDLTSVSATHNELATSKAIKDLVNGMRPKYVQASGGTLNLNQQNVANGGTKTYNIADFTATGNPSDFDTSKITAILVQGFVACADAANEINVSLPSSQSTRICRISGNGFNETSTSLFVPINSGQSTFVMDYQSNDTSQGLYTESKIKGFIYQPSL